MIPFAKLVTRLTSQQILAGGLAIAKAVGLPVTSWEIGDPTEAEFQFLTAAIADLEALVYSWVSAAFLDICAADSTLYNWLVWLAYQVYGYTARTASYATTTITLTNSLGGYYTIDPGDLTFKDSTTGQTFHNTSGGILASGPTTTLVLDIVADVPGSVSSAAIGDIDTIITPLTGVTCSNPAAAIGYDAEPAQSIVTSCHAKLAMMSPNGARDAYNYVCTTPSLSGTSAITMARSSGSSLTGAVTVLVAGPNMPIGAPDLALASAAVQSLCTPLCITPTVVSADAAVFNITYQAWGYQSWSVTTAQAAALIEAALRLWFAARPIAGDVVPPATAGIMYVSMIAGAIQGARPDKITRVLVTLPASDQMLSATQKPICGTVTASVPFTFIPDP